MDPITVPIPVRTPAITIFARKDRPQPIDVIEVGDLAGLAKQLSEPRAFGAKDDAPPSQMSASR